MESGKRIDENVEVNRRKREGRRKETEEEGRQTEVQTAKRKDEEAEDPADKGRRQRGGRAEEFGMKVKFGGSCMVECALRRRDGC